MRKGLGTVGRLEVTGACRHELGTGKTWTKIYRLLNLEHEPKDTITISYRDDLNTFTRNIILRVMLLSRC